MLAVDLLGIDFEVSDATFSPGAAVPVTWQLANQGADTAWSSFEVHFFLSRDATITTNDLFVGARTLPAGFPGYYAIPPQADTIYLPPSSHAIWNGSGTYFLGSIVDPYNFVFESNEFNNFNRGVGLDVDFLQISAVSAQPDLFGTSLMVNTAQPQPGGQLSVSFGIINGGGQSAGPFQISFFLSTDANINVGDRMLGTSSASGLAAGARLSNTTVFTLPSAGDAIYAGGGQLFVGMIVDSANAVIESNEANNSNNPVLGTDIAVVDVDDGDPIAPGTDIDLEQLPPTGIAAGQLLSYVYGEMRKSLNSMNKDLKTLQTDLEGVADLSGTRKLVSAVSADIGRFVKLIDTVRKGKSHSVDLGSAGKLDLAQLELAERFVVLMLNSNLGAQTGGAEGEDWDDPFATLKTAIKNVLDMTDPAQLKAAANSAWEKAAAVTGPVGAGLSAKAVALTTSLMDIAKLGRAKTLEGDQTGLLDAVAQAEGTVGSNLMDMIKEKADELLDKVSPDGAKIKKLYEDLRGLGKQLPEVFRDISNDFNAAITGVRKRLFKGVWTGTDHTTLTYTDGSVVDSEGPAKFSFSSGRGGFLTGTIKFVFQVVDQFGNLIRKSTTTGSFKGQFTETNRLQGEIKLKAPTGQKLTTGFEWQYDGENLTGAMYEGSTTTFSVKKK